LFDKLFIVDLKNIFSRKVILDVGSGCFWMQIKGLKLAEKGQKIAKSESSR